MKRAKCNEIDKIEQLINAVAINNKYFKKIKLPDKMKRKKKEFMKKGKEIRIQKNIWICKQYF